MYPSIPSTASAVLARGVAPERQTRGTLHVPTASGEQLFVRSWGHGRPVLFLAAWATPSEAWALQMRAVVDAGLRAVAYDRRGHGRSDDTGGGYDYDTLVDDLRRVMDTLDLRDVTLVAHSMAGGEAVRYLARSGGARVRNLVLLAPTTPFPLQTADNPEGAPQAVFTESQWQIERDFPGWLDDNTPPFVLPETSTGMRNWIKAMMLQTSLQAVVELRRAIPATDFRAEMRALRTPTLVVHGDRDASAPIDLTGRRSAALIPGARLEIYAGAPHGLIFTHAERLQRDLLAFAGA